MINKTFELIDKFHPLPIHIPVDKVKLEEAAELLFLQMFPVDDKIGVHECQFRLKECAITLTQCISRLRTEEFANSVVNKFFEQLTDIQSRLYNDAKQYLKNDPAAKSIEEVIIAYPGFYALSIHRLAHALHKLDIPLIPRLFAEYAHAKVGIDIHPAAKIGDNFFMDHGTGIVIGETTEIGTNVKIYQGVTLGALYVEKNMSESKRHPTIQDNVVIYANATILGGDTVIGHNSTIGGGTWLTKSVIPFSLVYNSVDVKIKTVKDFVQPIDFVI